MMKPPCQSKFKIELGCQNTRTVWAPMLLSEQADKSYPVNQPLQISANSGAQFPDYLVDKTIFFDRAREKPRAVDAVLEMTTSVWADCGRLIHRLPRNKGFYSNRWETQNKR